MNGCVLLALLQCDAVRASAMMALHTTRALPQQEGGRRTSSMHRGVSWNKTRRKWKAQLSYGGRNRHLGYFADKDAAAVAYNKAAQALQATGALPQKEGGRRTSS